MTSLRHGFWLEAFYGRRRGEKGDKTRVAYSPEAVSTKSDITLVPYLKANRAAVNTYKYNNYQYTTTV